MNIMNCIECCYLFNEVDDRPKTCWYCHDPICEDCSTKHLKKHEGE